MRSLIYAFIVGLFGAGIVHIAVLLLVPVYTERDAWSRLAETSGLHEITRIGAGDAAVAINGAEDPLFRTVACRFDLAEGVTHVHADGQVPFWSLSVYDRVGQSVFSFNESTATDGVLDVAVLTPVQTLKLRTDLPPEFGNTVFVETGVGEGIIVVRAFVPDDTWSGIASDFLDRIACEAK